MRELRIASAATGVRRWYGNELLDAQLEVLQPLQEFFAQAGNCILTGCQFSGVSYPLWISPGIVCLQYPIDGFKLARFAGGSINSGTGFLTLQKTPINGVYDGTGNTGLVGETYTCVLASSAPASGGYLEIGPAVGQGKIFAEGYGLTTKTAPVTVSVDAGPYTGTLTYVKNMLANTLHIRGGITVNNANTTTIPIPATNYAAVNVLPVGYRPATRVDFMAHYIVNNSDLLDASAIDNIRTVQGSVLSSGAVGFRPIRSSAASSYTVSFNTIIPLD